jgi:hypothetical protein
MVSITLESTRAALTSPVARSSQRPSILCMNGIRMLESVTHT